VLTIGEHLAVFSRLLWRVGWRYVRTDATERASPAPSR
jgi:hypothetical protein